MVKKISFPLLFLSIIASFFLFPIIKPGVVLTHDGVSHIVRLGAFYKALTDFQIPPRWAGDLNYRYGVPALNFHYPLPYYVGSLIHFLGFDLQTSFKLLSIIAFILAAITFYLWLSEFLQPIDAFIGSIFYVLTPYHFLNIYVRGDTGELVSFAIVPLVFWAMEKNIKHTTIGMIIVGSICYGLLLLSHNIMSLIFTPIILMYVIIRSVPSRKKIITNVSMIIIGLFLGAFFWLPALYDEKFINHRVFAGYYIKQFPTVLQLLYSPWGFGTDVATKGGLSPEVGPLLILIVILGFIVIFRLKQQKNLLAFWISAFFVFTFMATKTSLFFWQHISLLQQFQFPWRFVGPASFSAAVIAGFVSSYFSNNNIKWMLLLFVCIYSLQFVQIKGYFSKSDQYYLSFPGTTSYHGEVTTIWTAGDAYQFPKFNIEIIDGKASIKNLSRKSNKHTFTIDAKDQIHIVDNTIYFPGWRVLIDDKQVPIEFQDSNHRGLITFSVPKGLHNIEVRFGETTVRLFADILSFVTVFVLITVFLRKPKRFSYV